ncbi:MAG: flagellar assembly protein FliH [Pseudomonadota bacterium]
MSSSLDSYAGVSAWSLPTVGEGHSEELDENEDLPAPPTADEIAAWEREARERGYKEGLEAGHTEGYTKGFDQGAAEVAQRTDLLMHLINSLEAPFAELDERVEESLDTLIVTLAQQLVRREIRAEPGEIVGVIREALALLPMGTQSTTIHLHPDDAELLRQVLSGAESKDQWKLAEDPLISRGGCRITTDTSRIDATTEARLAALAATMLGGEREGD